MDGVCMLCCMQVEGPFNATRTYSSSASLPPHAPSTEPAHEPGDFLGLLTKDFFCFLSLSKQFVTANTRSLLLTPALILNDKS